MSTLPAARATPPGERVEAVTVRRGDLVVDFRDNAQSPALLSGIQSLRNLRHAANFDAYDPDGRGSSAGLNFEHIISGRSDEANRFSPRHGPYACYHVPDSDTVTLVRLADDSPWKMASTMRYTVVAPHYVDFEFRCIPQDAARFGPRGYGIFFWANYMNQVSDVALNFRGVARPGESESWIAATAPPGHPDYIGGGTYRHVDAPALEYDENHNFKLNVWSYDQPRYARPFYYGRADHDMALTLMFDRGYTDVDEIRFSLFKFKVNDEQRKPAWDFQYVIHQVAAGREYGFRGRLAWTRFVSPTECRREYDAWAACLNAPQKTSQ
ncbi:MAG: hypothetical protein KDA63_09930 [Planctomycetales bacterium]|nr:hypothetical protein [Planctomycetales bacterium]